MISDDLLMVIEKQLGRPPRGLVEVAYSTEQGLPVVLRIRSLVDDKPFPTLYWLSSRDLHRALSQLETQGLVKQLEDELAEDEQFRERYLQNHRDYVHKRWQLMAPEDRQKLQVLGFSELFNRYGIGGIAQWDKVRCLHMHYADYLCCDGSFPANVIGERIEQQFQLKDLPLSF